MWFEEDFVEEAEEFGRDRKRRRRENLLCKCVEVRGQSERDCDCDEERGERERERCECRDREDIRGERERRRHCRSCICDELRELRKMEKVDLFLKGGNKIEDVRFIGFDDDTCCANFTKHHGSHDDLFVVDCRKIEALKIESKH